MSEWLPIESAPRDGTEFIACCAGYAPFSCRWHKGEFIHLDPDDGTIYYKPTDWQPLPERKRAIPQPKVVNMHGEELIGGLTDGEWMLEGFYREPEEKR